MTYTYSHQSLQATSLPFAECCNLIASIAAARRSAFVPKDLAPSVLSWLTWTCQGSADLSATRTIDIAVACALCKSLHRLLKLALPGDGEIESPPLSWTKTQPGRLSTHDPVKPPLHYPVAGQHHQSWTCHFWIPHGQKLLTISSAHNDGAHHLRLSSE